MIESVAFGDEVGVDRPAGQPLKGERPDKGLCGVRQYDVDLCAKLREVTRELDALVSCDAAGDAEQHAPAGPRPSRCEGRAGAAGGCRRTRAIHDQALFRRRLTSSNSMLLPTNASSACVVSFFCGRSPGTASFGSAFSSRA